MRQLLFILALLLAGLTLATFAGTAGNAPSGVHPVVDTQFGYLFGGTVNGKWVDGDHMVKYVKGGEQYRIYAFSRFLGTGVGKKAVVDNGPPASSPSVDVAEAKGVKDEKGAIAISGDWNALPRVPKEQSTTQQAYIDAVHAFLAQKGLPNAPANITRVLRVDLEGDGKDEVLISATTPRMKQTVVDAQKGDYSFVMMRKVVNGQVKTSTIDGEFYPKDTYANAPNIYTLEGALDVNGDGVLELILGWHYYEGSGRSIYQIDGLKVKEVLSAGEGA